MTLNDWQSNGWLRAHNTSAEEIGNLFGIIERDLTDAQANEISDDRRFGIAYNAALKLCTILLYASGFRPEKNLAHYRTLAALPEILGSKREPEAKYLDKCREKRNTAEYDYIGEVSRDEADELIEYAKELRDEVIAWLKTNHSQLLPKSK